MTRIRVIQCDITEVKADAIVNAANRSLLGGGGVDGAIHRAAGPELLRECAGLNGCATGEAKITRGYNLPAKFVIHTVGPVWDGEDDAYLGEVSVLLTACYTSSLRLARDNGLRTIAFPAISTGAYRYPKNAAASMAVNAVFDFMRLNPGAIDEITFALYDEESFAIYKDFLPFVKRTYDIPFELSIFPSVVWRA